MTTAVAVDNDAAPAVVSARPGWHARLVAWVKRHPKLATALFLVADCARRDQRIGEGTVASTCKRGHPMAGDNVMVIGVAKQRRCRTCFEAYQRNRRARNGRARTSSSESGGTARTSLDPALLAELRRQVGIEPDGPEEPAR